jgi:uncharacterized membrane-anchored protein
MDDHPLRYALANELHARPFPALAVPSRAAYLAIKHASDSIGRTPSEDRAHLVDLLSRHGAPHPEPGATHWMGQIGRHWLKWECHTEFVTYTLFTEDTTIRPFDPAPFDLFPQDWLARAPGIRFTSILIDVTALPEEETVTRRLEEDFVSESLAVSQVIDGAAIIAGDFRIDPAGHMRFALFVRAGTGPRRVGRILQRLTEIETYKAMSMLGFARTRELSARMGPLDRELARLMQDMQNPASKSEETLRQLLDISAEAEGLRSETSFRFGATAAYEALVNQRIAVLREERFGGRQTFAEFMARRFDPSMRTVKATERRLDALAAAASRAGELLRTRVDVERSAQNQKLLESMDRRADLQLRLQKTVEGLSVVAISYYALNLLTYLLAPLAAGLHLDKPLLTALLVPVTVIAVWLAIHRIRKTME